MIDFFTGPAVVWLYKAFFWAVFAITIYAYWNRGKTRPLTPEPARLPSEARRPGRSDGGRAPGYLREFSKRLVKITIGFYVVYAAFLTWGQYYVWSQNSLGKIFLVSDRFGVLDGSSGYFLFYSYLRFWLGPAIAILAGFIFYLFLKSLKRYRERFFEEGETELGFLSALLAGWPQFAVFLPLVFLGVVLISAFRLIVFKERFTTLGWPLLISLLPVLVWGGALIEMLGLKALRI